MLNIDVVIVNFNGGIHLRKCLESLDFLCSEIISSIVVVDNNSHDGSFSDVEKIYISNSMFKMIRLDQNIGFGAACNHGAAHSNAEFILFLNPDTFLSDDIFKILADYTPSVLKGNIPMEAISK